MSRLTIRVRKKPAKKSEWMKGFVIPKKADEFDSMSYELAMRKRDYWHRMVKRGKGR